MVEVNQVKQPPVKRSFSVKSRELLS